jgi:hypothetical protein
MFERWKLPMMIGGLIAALCTLAFYFFGNMTGGNGLILAPLLLSGPGMLLVVFLRLWDKALFLTGDLIYLVVFIGNALGLGAFSFVVKGYWARNSKARAGLVGVWMLLSALLALFAYGITIRMGH